MNINLNEDQCDQIRAVQLLCRKLSRIQDEAFDELVERLGLQEDKCKEDWLFDFVYNQEGPETFLEYVQKYNI